MTSVMPGNCRTAESVTATQPPQVQPRMLKPSRVRLAVNTCVDERVGGAGVSQTIVGAGFEADSEGLVKVNVGGVVGAPVFGFAAQAVRIDAKAIRIMRIFCQSIIISFYVGEKP